MATKKVNEIKDGDIKSNIVVLRSVFGKVGLKYFIQPQKDKRGHYPDCVRKVDSHGDMILSENDKNSGKVFIPETQVFVYTDGKTFNLDDPYEAAEWEAVKNSELIAPDRFAKDSKGDYLIDGTIDPKSKRPRYGVAELYVDRPGYESQIRVTKRKLIVNASNFILNDERGYEGRLLIARVLGRDMKNQPNPDVEDYLLSIAEKTPEKIIQCYTGGDMKARILFIEAREKGVIYKKDGLYLFGEDGTCMLGATDDACVEWINNPKNQKSVALIRKETYPDMFVE